MGVQVANDAAMLDAAVSGSGKDLVVAYLWAAFHEACKPGGQMDQVIDLLASRQANVEFVKLDAEANSDVAERYGVSVVPTFVFFKQGQKVDILSGATPANLQAAIERNLSATASPSGAAPSEGGEEAIEDKLRRLTQSSHVMLFMKGSAAEPRCKFSRAMIELLNGQGVRFATFDVLSDPAVREGLKTFSGWPTYPQLFVAGSFVGGVDAVKEIVEKDGGAALKSIISEKVAAPARTARPPPSAPSAPAVNDEFLSQLVRRANVMLFMKGEPDAPQCGFSARMVELLRKNDITSFGHFNILENEEVRAKLKEFAKWPTYPQLWVNGTLIGGLDIVQEMAEDDDLAEQLGIEPLEKRLKGLIGKAPVVLFMKGSPEEPRCGFSREMIRILNAANAKYETFDILTDDEVRQGLKTFSNWPTYPQLYVNSKLIGGLDIVKELEEEDELQDVLTAAPAAL
mmetsp:Transcript_6348/g.16196  ORF Transcript_6348/g.16196 Transcript_6348/m.16196 type:complete len:457 (+) Transcript_6348:187-1557(+)